MSDQDRKGASDKRDEDEQETSGSEEESSEREEAEADEGEEKHAGEAEGEEEGGDEGDEAAKRVAASLGVGDEEAEAKGEEKAEAEEAAPVNRAQRRAEASQRRKKRKGASAEKSADGDADEPLPKDKNARAKELLKRRREQAAEARPIQLLPGEMVDDALARGSSALSKWIRENFNIIQWVILGTLVVGGGFIFYESRVEKSSASTTDALMVGVDADRGYVLADDKRSQEQKEADPTKVFKTVEERADAAIAGYQKVLTEHGGSAAALLARLGEANDFLDKHEWDKALEAFSAVSQSPLAAADPDVKTRALEGMGFAKEGKGDVEGAMAAFKELESVDFRGDKELGMYHQGRLLLAKGDTDKAKDLLKQVHDKLEQPTTEGQQQNHFLQLMTDDLLRRIDPSLVPQKQSMTGPKGGLTAEQIEKLKRQLEEKMRNTPQEKH